jgi:hypothetical protein
MSNLILHCGGQRVNTLQELDLIPVPEQTRTYRPVPHPHAELVRFIRKVGDDMLTTRGYEHRLDQYGVAAEGRRFFGISTYTPEDGGDLGLCIGYRNSYDKSMSVGVALGASVFICDNLALSGEITILRKHTKGVWEALQEMAITSIYRAGTRFRQVQADAQALKALPLERQQGYRLLGGLFGEDVLSVRQLVKAAEQWDKPVHEDFQPRNAWSLYNACTEALKTSNPMSIMEDHTNLHRLLSDKKWVECVPETPQAVEVAEGIQYLPPAEDATE